MHTNVQPQCDIHTHIALAESSKVCLMPLHLLDDPLLLLIGVEDLKEGLVDVRLVLEATLVIWC